MSKIRIETEMVREAGQRIVADAERLAQIGRSLQSATDGLDTWAWDGVSRARAEPLLGSVSNEAARVAETLSGLGRKLTRVADVFEHEDQVAARALEGMPWVDWDSGGLGGPTFHGDPTDDRPDFRWVPGGFGATYGTVTGDAFILGAQDSTSIHPNDVDQGALGDCFFLAPLAAIALQDPATIQRMVRDNEDGTFTVTLYDRPGLLSSEYDPVDIVVTPEFPLRFGRPVFAGVGDTADGQRELWPMLVEKAYAQHRGSYNNLHGGWSHVAMEGLLGVDSERLSPTSIDLDDLADRFDSGQVITVASMRDAGISIGGVMILDIPDRSDRNPLYQDGTLVASHEYYLTGVDREAETVSIRNPWGWSFGEVTLPFDQFQESFRRVAISPLTQ